MIGALALTHVIIPNGAGRLMFIWMITIPTVHQYLGGFGEGVAVLRVNKLFFG